MPHPAETNWGIRSDLTYDINHRSHARRLTSEQAENQDDEPSILKSAGTSGQPGPSGLLFQRTGNRNLKRYKQLLVYLVQLTAVNQLSFVVLINLLACAVLGIVCHPWIIFRVTLIVNFVRLS